MERFDRGRQGPTVVRRHAEDLCQALGNQTIYERDGGPTATQILDLLGDRAGNSKLRFVEALIGTYLLGSPDGHAPATTRFFLKGNKRRWHRSTMSPARFRATSQTAGS